MRKVREDSGAIAVLVAILLPTVLLTVGALAVDLGAVYVQKSAQDGLAELAALAGARKLPDIPEARKAALAVMCDPANAQAGWPADTCTYDKTNPADWRGTRAPGTGQITFFTDDGTPAKYGLDDAYKPDGKFDTDHDPVSTNDADTGIAIQITLPRVQVDFHFAQIFNIFPGGGQVFDSTNVAQTATARIGTPLGTGTFPFYVTPQEVKSAANPTADNRFCVRDPQTTPTGAYPGPQGNVAGTLPIPSRSQMEDTETNRTITMTSPVSTRARLGYPANPQVWFLNEDTNQVYKDTNATLKTQSFWIIPLFQTVTATVPDNMPVGTYSMWVQNGAGTQVTQYTKFTIKGTGAPEPCFRPTADRGFLDIGRQDDQTPDAGVNLRHNVKRGVQPTMHTINSFPSLVDLTPILTAPALVTNLVCESPLLQFVIQIVTVVVNPFDINCVKVDPTPGFSVEVSNGLFDTGGEKGRMLRQCSPATSPSIPGRGGTIDGTDLFPAADNSPLVNKTAPGVPFNPSATHLRQWIEDGQAPVPGWINNTVFSCPRFGLVPIVAAGPGADGDYAILGFTYVWLDDDLTAFPLTTGGGTATGIQGHIIDPKWFLNPATDGLVAGSTVVGDYMGPDLPKEAVLVKD